MNAELRKQIHKVLTVWLALMALALLTMGSAYIPLGMANTVINTGISVLKTLLVAAVFMHLRQPYPVYRLVCAVALAMLVILFSLSGIDYATRVPPSSPAPQGPDTPHPP